MPEDTRNQPDPQDRWGFSDPLAWAANIAARLEAGISVPLEEVNAQLVAAGEEPVDLSMTRDEARAELADLIGVSVDEIDEVIAEMRRRQQGRRLS
jgi:hypothetical protein